MTETTKRKHVERELCEEYPLIKESQVVVRIQAPRGNNLHEALWPDGSQFLVSMPTKFRKHIYIKRGDFVIVDPIEEGDKVKGEIAHILLQEDVANLVAEGQWPLEFADIADKICKRRSTKSIIHDVRLHKPYSESDGDTDNDFLIQRNPNHAQSDSDSEND
eukprot:gene11320-3356_t